jgi:hypothetical protein
LPTGHQLVENRIFAIFQAQHQLRVWVGFHPYCFTLTGVSTCPSPAGPCQESFTTQSPPIWGLSFAR